MSENINLKDVGGGGNHKDLLDMPSDTNSDHDGRYYTEDELSSSGGSDLIGDHSTNGESHSIKDTFNHTLNSGVSETITVSLTGGLGISWTAGEVYDASTHEFVITDAGSGTLVSDQVNYLKYTGTSTLELQTSSNSGDEISVAVFSTINGMITGYRETSLINNSISNTRRSLRLAFPNRIINGMSVHEDTDATNSLDVSMDAGQMIKDGIEEKNPTAINSRTLPLVRLFHSGGNWTNDYNAEIDTLQYDNGNDLANIPSNKWAKGYFIYAHHQLGWVYPTTYYNTKAQAQAGALSPVPEGLSQTPKLTAVVYQQGDTDFSNAVWQDIRPGISEESFNLVTNHGDLSGLSDDDHPQYLLVDGTRAMTGDLNFPVIYTGGRGIIFDTGFGNTSHFVVGESGAIDLTSRNVIGTDYCQLRMDAEAGLIFRGTNTQFYPNTTNVYDLGTSLYQWKDLYLAGNLSDGTNSITIAHTKDAYDYRVETWGDGLTKTDQEVNVDFASIAETDTGTETIKALTPDGLQGSKRNIRYLTFSLVANDSDCETGTNLYGDFEMPFNGTFLQDDSNKYLLSANNSTAGITGTMVVDVNLNGTTIMTTNKINIETEEKSSTDATTQPDLTTTTFSAGDILTIDVDAIHTTAAKGLSVTIAVRED